MKKNKLVLGFLLVSFVFGLFSLSPEISLAGCDLVEQPFPNWTEVSGVCVPTTVGTGLSEQPVRIILRNFMNWLLIIVGIIAVIAFVITGIQYLIAVGDEKAIETAKRNMKWSIVGVVISISGLIIVTAVDAMLDAVVSRF